MDDMTMTCLRRALAEGGSGNAETVRDLEGRFAELVGAGFALCMASGTSALICSLWAAGVRPGDAVAVSALGPAMTGLAVTAIGARPVFLDAASPTSFGVSGQASESALGHAPKAVVLVPMWGYWDERQDALDVFRANGIPVIVDAAQAPFLRLREGLCDVADIVCLSLHARKPLKAGEGGVCLTNDRDLAERILSLRNFGQVAALDGGRLVPTGAFATTLGANFKMNALGAAWCLAQMSALDEVRTRFDRLRECAIATLHATGINWIEASQSHTVVEHGRYGIVAISNSPRDAHHIAAALEAVGVQVDTSRYQYSPMYKAPFLSRYASTCNAAETLTATAVACRLEAFLPALA